MNSAQRFLAITLSHSKGGQFIVHPKALLGKPNDGHMLSTIIPEIERRIGVSLKRIFCDAGTRRNNQSQQPPRN